MTTFDALLLLVSGVVWIGAFSVWERYRHAPAKEPVVVEEYQIEIVETEGFKKLLVKFQDAAGRMHRFSFQPAYAHHFSDDLLRNTATAMRPEAPGLDDVGGRSVFTRK